MTDDRSSADAASGGAMRQNRRNEIRLALMCLGWAVCFVAASQLIERELLPAGPLRWLVAALPIVLFAVVLLTYIRYLRETDELQRLVQLQALALGFGVGWLAIANYPLLVRLGAPPVEAADYTLVMAASYVVGLVVGWRRYR